MPQKNAIKDKIPESFYHVYARGSSKQPIFLDTADYKYFLGLLQRYLADDEAYSKTGVLYPNYHDQVELLAYCLMRNHFHLLLYQDEVTGMEKLMRSLMTSYSRYFNLKYKRSGSVFESRYKAKLIDRQSYLEHISRYIHLNPRLWEAYRYSSLSYYLQRAEPPTWLSIEKITGMFSGPEKYRAFLNDYVEARDMLAEIKDQLADK